MIDKLITVTIMLFILSMISERIVTFFKLWCVRGNSFLFFIVSKDVDTSTPSDDPAAEAQRTKSILAINLTISFLVALISKASIFDIFNFSESAEAISLLGWDWEKDTTAFRIGSILVGCVFTGSFISLGSKFWHDLLDLLMNVKDLKEKMVDKETYQINNLKQLDEFIQTDSYDLAKICLEQNQGKIASLTGLEDYFIGLSSEPGNRKPVIILHSSLASGGSYPTSYKAVLNSGKAFTVGVETVYGFSTPSIQLDSGDSVCNAVAADKPGTACCIVKKKDVAYILTCAHVLTGGLPDINVGNTNGWITSPLPDDTLSEDTGFEPIGTWSFGLINDELDVALVETQLVLDPVVNIKNNPPGYDHVLNGQEVFVNGNKNKSKAFVTGYSEKGIDFQYNGKKHTVRKLIVISKNRIGTPSRVTEGGDSGAMVYLTKDKTAMGMVVGGNAQFSYLIPIASILRATQSKLA